MYKYLKTHIYMDSNANEQVAFYLTHLKKKEITLIPSLFSMILQDLF